MQTAVANISKTLNEVSSFSLNTKRESEQEKINTFLDSILLVQNHVNKNSNFLEDFTTRFESLTSLEIEKQEQEQAVNLINTLVALSKDVHNTLKIIYIFYNNNCKQFASKEIKRFRLALDDFKEAYLDLENVFVILPIDEEFQKANDALQSL